MPRRSRTQPYDHAGARIYPPALDGTRWGQTWRVCWREGGRRVQRRRSSWQEAEALAENTVQRREQLAQAKDFMAQAAAELGLQRRSLPHRHHTVDELIDSYLTTIPDTAYRDTRESALRLHARPVIGQITMADWCIDDNRRTLATAACKVGQARTETVRAALRSVVNHGMERSWLDWDNDPMHGVKEDRTTTAERDEPEINRENLPTTARVQALIGAFRVLDAERWAVACEIMSRGGLRWGELLAVRPSSFVYGDQQYLKVTSSMEHRHGRWNRKDPKFGRHRITTIPASCVESVQLLCKKAEADYGTGAILFHGQRPDQYPDRQSFGRLWSQAAELAQWPSRVPKVPGGCPVCGRDFDHTVTYDGNPRFHHGKSSGPERAYCSRTCAQRRYERALWTPHDLRHFFACWMIDDVGASLAVVSRTLGHADEAFTLRRYYGLRGDLKGQVTRLMADW